MNYVVRLIHIYFLIGMFILGLYFVLYGPHGALNTISSLGSDSSGIIMESMETAGESLSPPIDPSCPNMLVKSGNTLVLYNSKTPDATPVTFEHVDEYIKYLEKQRDDGLRCPVLFLQEENNAQGETVYRVRPTMDDTKNGLPSTFHVPGVVLMNQSDPRANPLPHYPMAPYPSPYDNTASKNDNNMYASFDPLGLYVGKYTQLDKIHSEKEVLGAISDNPMDSNWGGVSYTEQQVANGTYSESSVFRPVNSTMGALGAIQQR